VVFLAVEIDGYEAGLKGQSHECAFFCDGPGDAVFCHFDLGVCRIGDAGEEIDERADLTISVLRRGRIMYLFWRSWPLQIET